MSPWRKGMQVLDLGIGWLYEARGAEPFTHVHFRCGCAAGTAPGAGLVWLHVYELCPQHQPLEVLSRYGEPPA